MKHTERRYAGLQAVGILPPAATRTSPIYSDIIHSKSQICLELKFLSGLSKRPRPTTEYYQSYEE